MYIYIYINYLYNYTIFILIERKHYNQSISGKYAKTPNKDQSNQSFLSNQICGSFHKCRNLWIESV